MAVPSCSGDDTVAHGDGPPRVGYFQLILHWSRRRSSSVRRLLRLILRLSVLLRSTCREGHGDHNSEKITHNGNRKGSHRRRFVKFSAVAPLGFASVFWPIGRSFYFDLAMDVLKIEFQAKFFFFTFFGGRKKIRCGSRWRQCPSRRSGLLLR